MQNWLQKLRKNTGLSPYVWIVFYILPFYFIFQDSSTIEVVFGITAIIVFFICYVLSFVSKGWLVYFWTSILIAISTAMSLQFGYIYFSLFLAFFIGHLKHSIVFFVLYAIHLISTFATINYGFVTQNPVFIKQMPFVFLCLIAVILLPVSTYNRNKEDKLQGQLEDANKRISELVKLEERQRIARDLHDTLGQKLSLIGLKSDLAGRLMDINPEQAKAEIQDVQSTARIALKEVREMVTQMRGEKLDAEILQVEQILKAADIAFQLQGEINLDNTSLIAENVVSMCVKEAVTNVVKHSGASLCTITIDSGDNDLIVTIHDNGRGIEGPLNRMKGNGLRGMQERLEFVNGSLDIRNEQGTTLVVKVPKIIKQNDEVIQA